MSTTAAPPVDDDGRLVERTTVGLTRRSADELRRMHADTGLSKADLVNRAVALYGLVDRLTDGHELLVRCPDGKLERVWLI